MSQINLQSLPIIETESIPPKRMPGRCVGSFSGLSARIRSLQLGKGLEFPAPDKLQERSLRSMVSSLSRSTGCEFTVRLSQDRQTIGVYRLK